MFKWIALFLIILILTQTHLFVSFESLPSFLGFPKWLFWYGFVHAIFVLVLYFYNRSEEQAAQEL